MEEKRKIIFHRNFQWEKLGKKCSKRGVLGRFSPFLSIFVSHETQPPKRIVPRETYVFAPFFTLSGVFHMKRRFYYIFAIFNEILISCETSVLCEFVTFHCTAGCFLRCFRTKCLAKQFVHLDFAINKCPARLLLRIFADVVGAFVL